MKLELLFLEAEGRLYAGYGFDAARLQWSDGCWAVLGQPEKLDVVGLTPKEAERCYPGSTVAALPEGYEPQKDFLIEDVMRLRPEKFDSWDFSHPIRRSPEEENARDQKYADLLRDIRSRMGQDDD